MTDIRSTLEPTPEERRACCALMAAPLAGVAAGTPVLVVDFAVKVIGKMANGGRAPSLDDLVQVGSFIGTSAFFVAVLNYAVMGAVGWWTFGLLRERIADSRFLAVAWGVGIVLAGWLAFTLVLAKGGSFGYTGLVWTFLVADGLGIGLAARRLACRGG